MTIADRAAGAVIGALVGDALGLGTHWYYDLDELRAAHGEWITDYKDPDPDRYHGGMKAGQLDQTGLILVMLLRSVVENKGYRESDFTERLDRDLFPYLDGTPAQGPGGYTSQSIRDAYRKRRFQHSPWGEVAGPADTTEAAERAIVLAARFARHPAKVAQTVSSNCALTQSDQTVMALSTAFNLYLAMLVQGEPFTIELTSKLMDLVKSGDLPFHTVTTGKLQAPRPGDLDPSRGGKYPSPDALLTPAFIAEAVADPNIRIEPAWKVSLVYGMPCAIYHQLPAAYYLAIRFSDDFESAVLHAINGGGQNMARACLTGALVGAQVGLSGIPKRFVAGLENSEELVILARRLGELAAEG